MVDISIIIPAYNAEKYIRDCMNSVLNQTFKNIEIICIDDGSTDSTGKILDEYSLKDSRITVIHQENRGQTKGRKVGIEKAIGKYIAFVDSDDWLDSHMYEEMYCLAEEYNVEAVCCGYYSVQGKTRVKVFNDMKSGLYGKDSIYQYLFDCNKATRKINWSYWTYLFNKNSIYEYIMNIDDEIKQGEDIVGVWSFLINAKSIYVINAPFYFYRVTGGTSSRKENDNFLFHINRVYLSLKKQFQKNEHAEYLIHMLKHMLYDLTISGSCFFGERKDFFLFPYERIPANSNVVLYGAGMVGKSYYRQLKNNHFCNLVAWVDRAFENISSELYCIENPAKIKEIEFDYLLIALVNYGAIDAIVDEIIALYDIPRDKIITSPPKRLSLFVDME